MDRVDISVFSTSQDVALSDLLESEVDDDRWPMGWTIWLALGGGAALWLVIATIFWLI
jgi:hypothetical protein